MSSRRNNAARLTLAGAISVVSLSGCYVVPAASTADGKAAYAYSPVPIVPSYGAATAPQPIAVPVGPMPATLNVKPQSTHRI